MKKKKLARAFINLMVALGAMIIAQIHLLVFLKGGGQFRMSHLLLFVQFFFIAFFFLARYTPTQVSWSVKDVFASLTGTFAPFFFSLTNHGEPKTLGVVLQVLGSCLSLYAVLSLNRSIGILPAHRAIQTSGMYRWIRHPFYASYQVFNAGYLINHLSLYNAAVALIGLFSQILRIYSEERILLQDPLYRAYQTKVRWRMFPYIF